MFPLNFVHLLGLGNAAAAWAKGNRGARGRQAMGLQMDGP